MADKRMISSKIISSDDFTDMSLEAQALYMHLILESDDEGFTNRANRIRKAIGASADAMQELIDNKFIYRFETGITVIKHWKMHNQIQPSRLVPTQYTEERAKLVVKENKSYTLADNLSAECRQNVAEIRLDKIRLDKISSIIPTLEQVEDYVKLNNLSMSAQDFYNYYNKVEWVTSKGEAIKNWKSLVLAWERRDKEKAKGNRNKFNNYESRPKKSEEFYNSLLAVRSKNG